MIGYKPGAEPAPPWATALQAPSGPSRVIDTSIPGSPVPVTGAAAARLISGPGGVLEAAPSKQVQIPPYWQQKPPSGLDFYYNVEAVLGAGAGATVVLADVPAIILTDSYEGVVASVNIFVNAPTTDFNALYALRFNQAPVQGWNRLRTFSRNANSISIEFSGTVFVGPNTTIDALVTNRNAFGPWTVGIEVTGWVWPIAERVRVFGEQV